MAKRTKNRTSSIHFSVNGREFHWEGPADEAARKLDEFMAQVFAPLKSMMRPTRTWRTTLGFREDHARPTLDQIDAHFRRLAKAHHPDHGGKPENFRRIVAARDEAKRELA